MSDFKPIPQPPTQPSVNEGHLFSSVTVTTTLKGKLGEEFEKMVEENNLNRSSLLRQMIIHCLGYTEELERMRRSLWSPDDRSQDNP